MLGLAKQTFVSLAVTWRHWLPISLALWLAQGLVQPLPRGKWAWQGSPDEVFSSFIFFNFLSVFIYERVYDSKSTDEFLVMFLNLFI